VATKAKAPNPIFTTADPTGGLGPREAVAIPPSAKWISARQVCARYGGRSLMWLERKLKNDPSFPRPTYFGSLRYWQPTSLDAYDNEIIEQQMNRADRIARGNQATETA
jgi:hypothetical protein